MSAQKQKEKEKELPTASYKKHHNRFPSDVFSLKSQKLK